MVRLDDKWYIFDVTNPDFVQGADGRKNWRPGMFQVDGPPPAHGSKRYAVTATHSGLKHVYTAHNNMNWRIDHAAAA